MNHRVLWGVLLVVAAAIMAGFSLAAQFVVPAPTGPQAVGRDVIRWVDTSRLESSTPQRDDFREIIVQMWYPANPGTGSPAPYFPNLDRLSEPLRASGEVGALEAAGLRMIRSHSRLGAEIASEPGAFPVLLFSPGNATNVEFYATLGEELASHGYIVMALNHPYDVAAVELSSGEVAIYEQSAEADMNARLAHAQARIEMRTEDLLFVFDQLEAMNLGGNERLAGRLDLSSVGVMGHSLGGIAAAQACQRDQRIQACVNFDGLQAGGPFSAHADPALPLQPFMFMTKEDDLPPNFRDQLAALTAESYQIVIHRAEHNHFTDAPLLEPSLFPGASDSERINALVRAYTVAFLEETLRGRPSDLLSASSNGSEVDVVRYQ